MARHKVLIAMAVAALSAGVPVWAQDAARAIARTGFQIVSAPAGTRVMTQAEAQQVGVISTGAARRIAGATGDGAMAQNLLEGNFPVPGLGFDYTHLAAVNRNLETRALIDPVTQDRLALARQIRRETPAVPVFPFFPMVPQVIVVQSPPPVVVLQQTAAEATEAPALRAQRVGTAPREIVPETETQDVRPVEPHRELEEYVLARKDGGEIYVVAFSTQKGRVVYITRGGLRRSVALEELDGAATARRNEDRGADVKLPI